MFIALVLAIEYSLDVQLALAPWGLDNLPGAGMMIYPTSSSPSLLVGAIFLSGPFPDFAAYQQQPGRSNQPVAGQSSQQQVFGGFCSRLSSPTQQTHLC